VPKKNKNRSSKQAKQNRQNQARDRRRHGVPVGMKALETIGSPYDHSAMFEAFARAWAADSVQMLCSDGEVRHLSVARAHAYVNAQLLADGEPAADFDEVGYIVGEDILNGDMFLHTNGAWEASVDYFAEPGAEA
jgi:hypothetical protein